MGAGESLVVHDLIASLTLQVYALMLVRKGLSAPKNVFNTDAFVAASQNLSRLIKQKSAGILAVDRARSAANIISDYIDRKIIADHGSNLKYPEKR